MKHVVFLFSALSCLLSSCASIVNGEHQSVSVQTGEIRGATCTLSNNKGTWYLPSTPGSVVVHRSYHDLNVACQKPGYATGIAHVASSTKAMAFGNILFGGVIGAGVDVADGAAYDYPTNIAVAMGQTVRLQHVVAAHHAAHTTVATKKSVAKVHVAANKPVAKKIA